MNFDTFREKEMKDDSELREGYNELVPIYSIKKALIELRAKNNYTQKELSAATGISQGDISKFENGKGNPTFEILTRLAKAMNATIRIDLIQYDSE